MNSLNDFKQKLYTAAKEKAQWYDNIELLTLVEEYRNYRAVLNTLIGLLVKKGLLQPDPYKLDKKITDIVIPEDGEFKEADRATVLGMRLSEYESMLEYLCNYFKFSVENLSIERIKKLSQLNNFIGWQSLTATAEKCNNRALGEIIALVRKSAEAISVTVLNDSVNFATKTMAKITGILRSLVDFQKEWYKIAVRQRILDGQTFSDTETAPDRAVLLQFIRKHYAAHMGKTPFYTELIEEVLQEETALNRDTIKNKLLSKFSIVQAQNVKVRETVNARPLLFDALRSFAALSPQYDSVLEKIDENHRLLQSEHWNFWTKFAAVFRKAFNLSEKIIEYKIRMPEPGMGTFRIESLDYAKFTESLTRRSRVYTSFGVKNSIPFQKLENMDDIDILDYVQRQLAECQRLQISLDAIDEYFKANVAVIDRSRIKGIKIELASLQNSLIKINQRKAEYISLRAEEDQLKKLGIMNE